MKNPVSEPVTTVPYEVGDSGATRDLRDLARQIRALARAHPATGTNAWLPINACCDHLDAIAGVNEANRREAELLAEKAAQIQILKTRSQDETT